MIRGLLWAVLAVTIVPGARADQPAKGAQADACLVLNNRILGPRASGRPLPLSSGDPAHGFHPACVVPWSKLSPTNAPLPVTDCYQGSMLQVANDAACGRQTGPLWINSRWVLTSAELKDTQSRAVICQQLETGQWAGTRDLQLDCVPQKKELRLEPGVSSKTAEHGATATAVPAAAAAPNTATVPGATAAPAATPAHPDR